MKTRIEQDEVTTVCCVCGHHVSGPWPARGNLSHGYCRFHFLAAMKEVQQFHALLDRQQPVSAHALAA